jgi:replicative DNA helicase
MENSRSNLPRDSRILNLLEPPREELENILFSEEAERAFVAVLISWPSIFNDLEVGKLPEPGDFWYEHPRDVFTACQSIFMEKGRLLKSINTMELQMKLLQLGKHTPESYLVSLLENPEATPEHAEPLAAMIKQFRLRRDLDAAAEELKRQARSSELTPLSIVQNHTKRIMVLGEASKFSVSSERCTRDGSYINNLLYQEKEEPKNTDPWNSSVGDTAIVSTPKKMSKTGIVMLDGGTILDQYGFKTNYQKKIMLRRSRLSIVAADTGVGKSIMAHQIALVNECAGLNIRFYVNEESPEDMEDRTRARFVGIPIDRLAEHREMGNVLTDKEKESIWRFETWYYDFPGQITYVPASGMSGEDIKQDAIRKDIMLRQLSQDGRGYDLIIVDYIQKMARPRGMGYNTDNWAKTAENVTALAELAEALGVPVVATSQVSGRNTKEASERIEPALHNMADSQVLEHRAKLIIGLWRGNTESDETDAYLKILKNSSGAVGEKIPISFNPGRYHFGPDALQSVWEEYLESEGVKV